MKILSSQYLGKTLIAVRMAIISALDEDACIVVWPWKLYSWLFVVKMIQPNPILGLFNHVERDPSVYIDAVRVFFSAIAIWCNL